MDGYGYCMDMDMDVMPRVDQRSPAAPCECLLVKHYPVLNEANIEHWLFHLPSSGVQQASTRPWLSYTIGYPDPDW